MEMRGKIISITAIIIVAGVLAFTFLNKKTQKDETPADVGSLPASRDSGRGVYGLNNGATPPAYTNNQESDESAENPSGTALFRDSEGHELFDSVDNIGILEPLKSIIPLTSTPGGGNGASTQSDSLKKQLTDEQVFNTLWPREQIESANALQDYLIQEGFMSEAEREPLITDDEIIDVFAAFIGYMPDIIKKRPPEEYISILEKSYGIDYNSLDLSLFVKNNSELKKYYDVEFRNEVKQRRLLLEARVSAGKTPESGEGIFETIASLTNFISVPEAQAFLAGEWCGDIICPPPAFPIGTLPQCYKALGPVPYANLTTAAGCCNCGLLCTPIGCAFIPDCGPYSVACDVPLGCLNLMCALFPSATWDAYQPIPTFICQCG